MKLLERLTDSTYSGSLVLLTNKLSNSLGNYIMIFPYFNDHGKAHSERVIEYLDKLAENINLNDIEIYILLCSAWLHDIGMSNPKILGPGREILESPEKNPDDIRNNHHIKSSNFVIHFWKEFGIINADMAEFIADICKNHRKSSNLDEEFAYENIAYQGNVVHSKLLCALLRLADALDVDGRRISEINSVYFLSLPEESKRHWEISKLIRGIGFSDKEIHLSCKIENREIDMIKEKLIDLFEEYFLVLPVLNENKFPFNSIIAKITCKNESISKLDLIGFDIYMERLTKKLYKLSERNITAISNHLACTTNLSGKLKSIEIEERLKILENLGYNINTVLIGLDEKRLKEKPPLFHHYYFISESECTKSFIDSINSANEEIKIASTDGGTFPEEIKDILIIKIKNNPQLKVKILLRSRIILEAIEGGKVDSSSKIKDALKLWSHIRDQLNNGEQKSLEVRFIINEKFGHLNGSSIIDNKILRINIHPKNEKATEGELLQIKDNTNMIHVINHYFDDAWELANSIDDYMKFFEK